MKTFETWTQYKSACSQVSSNSYCPPVKPFFWVCNRCGKCSPDGDSFGRFAIDFYCFDCCDAMQRESMRDHSKPFGAYLSGDGKRVTTWTGGTLGTVSQLSASRSGWNGAEIVRFHVIDAHGALWHGRGAGRGMIATLRAAKPKKAKPARVAIVKRENAKFKTADGFCTRYALACGYVDSFNLARHDGVSRNVQLWHEGGPCLHVRVHEHNGAGRISWDSFDGENALTLARQAFRREKTKIKLWAKSYV